MSADVVDVVMVVVSVLKIVVVAGDVRPKNQETGWLGGM